MLRRAARSKAWIATLDLAAAGEPVNLSLAFKCMARNLAGIRKARALSRRSRKPPIGAVIVCDDVRMHVPAGMSDELWGWLMDQGWREVTYRPERRVYRQISAARAAQLADAERELRISLLESAMAHAESRRVHFQEADDR